MDEVLLTRHTVPVPESRAAPRKRLAIEVLLQVGDAAPLRTRLRDLSLSGFSASTPARVPEATPCRLTLPGREPVDAHVVWSEGGLVGCAFEQALGGVTYDAILERWGNQPPSHR